MNNSTKYILLDGSQESLRAAIGERDRPGRGMLRYLHYALQKTGLPVVVLKKNSGVAIHLLMHDASCDYLQVLEEQLQRLAVLYHGHAQWDRKHVITCVEFLELFQRRVLPQTEMSGLQEDTLLLERVSYSHEEMEELLHFNSAVLDELSKLFDLCMQIAESGTDIVLHQNVDRFEQFTLYVCCEQSDEVVIRLLNKFDEPSLLQVDVCFEKKEMLEEDYKNEYVKYTEKGGMYCCGCNITEVIEDLKEKCAPARPEQKAFGELLGKHCFTICKEQDIITFAGKSKELALACMIRECLDLPYVAMSKTGDNYAQIGLPISDTAVLRVLDGLYIDLKYSIFGESDVYDEDSTYSSIVGINRPKAYENAHCFYRSSDGYGWEGTDYIVTEDTWYYREEDKIASEIKNKSMLRDALQKAMGEYTGYEVRLSDAVRLVDCFIAYHKLIPVLKEISCHNGVLFIKLYCGKGVLRTDIYVKDNAVESVRTALEEAWEIVDEIQRLHCQVKSLNAFEADYRAYTECYAGGMLYRIMDTHF